MTTLPFGEAGITRIRRETKILLEPEEAELLVDALRGDVARYESRVVVVYFDSPDAKLARRAASTPDDCVKIRTKAYDPNLGSHAGRVVLEVKRERRGITSKRRRWLAPGDLPAEVRQSLEPIFGPLEPSITSSYHRRVFQCARTWRITFDDALRFHAADWSLLASGTGPSYDDLPPAFGSERRTIVELKHEPGALPEWLAAMGRLRGTRYSKFLAATTHADRLGTSRG